MLDTVQFTPVPLQGDALGLIFGLLPLVLFVVVLAGMWKAYEKADQPGWAAIIPIYNVYVLLKIVGRPVWWLILLFIPLVNFIIGIILAIDMAKAFDKGIGFAIGLMFLGFIFWPLLGFGDAEYQGAPHASPA